jgi:hypothetical protein
MKAPQLLKDIDVIFVRPIGDEDQYVPLTKSS